MITGRKTIYMPIRRESTREKGGRVRKDFESFPSRNVMTDCFARKWLRLWNSREVAKCIHIFVSSVWFRDSEVSAFSPSLRFVRDT